MNDKNKPVLDGFLHFLEGYDFAPEWPEMNSVAKQARAELAQKDAALDAARVGLKIQQLLNPVITDKDSYLWGVAEYALGNDSECPDPSNYGLDDERLGELAAALKDAK